MIGRHCEEKRLFASLSARDAGRALGKEASISSGMFDDGQQAM